MQALMMTAVNAMGNIDVIFNSAGAQSSGTVSTSRRPSGTGS